MEIEDETPEPSPEASELSAKVKEQIAAAAKIKKQIAAKVKKLSKLAKAVEFDDGIRIGSGFLPKEFFDEQIASWSFDLWKTKIENCRNKRSFDLARPSMTLVLPTKKARALLTAFEDEDYFFKIHQKEGCHHNWGEKYNKNGLPLELIAFEGSAFIVEKNVMNSSAGAELRAGECALTLVGEGFVKPLFDTRSDYMTMKGVYNTIPICESEDMSLKMLEKAIKVLSPPKVNKKKK